MIKAKEIRIGNRCTYGAHGVVIVSEIKDIGKVRVLHTEQHSIKGGYSSSLLHEDDIDPIPLTPEILEKCGFERNEEYDVNGYKAYRPDTAHYAITMYINDKEHVCAHYLRSAISTNHPQYLHQLQNLYFALTGEELRVKL